MSIKVRHTQIRKICFLEKKSETSPTTTTTRCGFKKEGTLKIEFEFISFKLVIILSKNIKERKKTADTDFFPTGHFKEEKSCSIFDSLII